MLHAIQRPNNMIEIKIKKEPLNPAECIEKTMDAECGGMSIFIGTIRNNTKEKKVVHLEYEAYESMALKELHKIAAAATDLYGVKNLCIHHRVGILQILDAAVVIAVNAPHREAAFAACRYIIDTLKQTVPIWKKEIFEDGELWTSAHA